MVKEAFGPVCEVNGPMGTKTLYVTTCPTILYTLGSQVSEVSTGSQPQSDATMVVERCPCASSACRSATM